MTKAFDKIKELMARNATHRKGFRIADQTPEFHLKYAAGEMIELAGALNPHDEICELADVFNALGFYAASRGYTKEAIEGAMLGKLETRFDKETK